MEGEKMESREGRIGRDGGREDGIEGGTDRDGWIGMDG
jgi:hypothetical protein